jgi:ABC-type Na+ efflux pump permease subunit
MSLRKTWIVLVKEMRHIWRGGSTLILVLIPVLVMIVFSEALAQDIRGVPITVLDRDKSTLSRRFLMSLSNSQDIVIGREAESYEQAEEWFDRSQTKALVVIPPGFGETLVGGGSVAVQIVVDGTDPTTAGHVITHAGHCPHASGHKRHERAGTGERTGDDGNHIRHTSGAG